MFHIFLHFFIPAVLAKVLSLPQFKNNAWMNAVPLFFRKTGWHIYFTLISATLIDLDHLLADPIYDPHRCSVGFHPLHQTPAIIVYFILCLFPKTRLVGVGLVIHILLDASDCMA